MPSGVYKHPKQCGFQKGVSHNNFEAHPNWKGDNVKYRALHHWVNNKLGRPKFCENCKNSKLNHRQYHWANISGNYKRIITDWRRLCVRCHKAFDKKSIV